MHVKPAQWPRYAGAVLVGIFLLALMPLGRMLAAKNDFVHWYVGGLLFGTPDLHDQATNQREQIKLIGGVLKDSYFIRPTFYGLLLKPLTWFPYKTAYWLYQIFSCGCVAFFLWVHGRRWPDLFAYAAMSVPLLSNLVNGQDVSLLLLFCTVSLLFAGRGWDFAAGLIFSLCAIKLHLFILMPLAILAARRWKILFGAAAGLFGLFVLGLTGGGWPVFLSWVRLVSRPANHPYPELMPNLRGMAYALAGGSRLFWAISAGAVAAMVLFLILNAPEYEEKFAYALIGGLLLNVHAYIQDPLLLLLAFAFLRNPRKLRAFHCLAQFILLPPVYLLLLWKPPWSGTFALALVAFLGTAVWGELSIQYDLPTGAQLPEPSG